MAAKGSLLDRELDELYKKARAGAKAGRGAASARKALAYVLKGIAAGAGLIIGFNVFPDYNQWLGIASVLAIFVDTLTQNYTRLEAAAQSGWAYHFLAEKVSRTYNRELGIAQEKAKQAAKAGVQLEPPLDERELQLKVAAHQELQTTIAEIEKKLSEQDLKALQALSLDAERAATRAVQTT